MIATRSFTWTIVPSSTLPSLNTSVSPDSDLVHGTFTAVYSDTWRRRLSIARVQHHVDRAVEYLHGVAQCCGPAAAARRLWVGVAVGDDWLGPLQNSQCSESGGERCSSNGPTLSLTVSMVFKAPTPAPRTSTRTRRVAPT